MGANVIEKITQDEHMYEEFKMDFSDYSTDLFSMENEVGAPMIKLQQLNTHFPCVSCILGCQQVHH